MYSLHIPCPASSKGLGGLLYYRYDSQTVSLSTPPEPRNADGTLESILGVLQLQNTGSALQVLGGLGKDYENDYQVEEASNVPGIVNAPYRSCR